MEAEISHREGLSRISMQLEIQKNDASTASGSEMEELYSSALRVQRTAAPTHRSKLTVSQYSAITITWLSKHRTATCRRV
jgi:hypothetical protein